MAKQWGTVVPKCSSQVRVHCQLAKGPGSAPSDSSRSHTEPTESRSPLGNNPNENPAERIEVFLPGVHTQVKGRGWRRRSGPQRVVSDFGRGLSTQAPGWS